MYLAANLPLTRLPAIAQAHSERKTHLKKILQDTKGKGDDIARRMQPLVAQLGDTIKHLDQVRGTRCSLDWCRKRAGKRSAACC